MCHTLYLLGGQPFGSEAVSLLLLSLFSFRYLIFRIFYQILFDFLNNFIFVFSVFLIFKELYVQYLIIIVCLFITFLQALAHWYAYESCFVGSSIYYQLSLGVDQTVTNYLFAAGWRLFKHLLLLSASESGAVYCTLHYFDFTVVQINFI